MSNAESQKLSSRKKLRNALLAVTNLQSDLDAANGQLAYANTVISSLDWMVAERVQRIHHLEADLSDAFRDIRNVNEKMVQHVNDVTSRDQAILGIIEKVATGRITGQEIVVLITYLGTSVPDALIAAAKIAFKPLLMELKAERQDQQGPLHVPALPPKKYGKIDERAHEDMVAEFSSNLIVGDAPDRTRYLLGCLSIECRTQVVEHLRNNMKLPAIKEVRSRTSCTLLEAKNTVETIQNMLEVLDRSPAAKKIAN